MHQCCFSAQEPSMPPYHPQQTVQSLARHPRPVMLCFQPNSPTHPLVLLAERKEKRTSRRLGMGAPDPMGTLLLLPQSTVEENSLFYRNTVNGKAEIPGCQPEAYFTPTAADQLCISPHPPPSSIPVRNPGSIPDTSPPSCPTFNPSPCPVYSTSLRELKTPLSTSITAALVQDSVVSQPHAHPAHWAHSPGLCLLTRYSWTTSTLG